MFILYILLRTMDGNVREKQFNRSLYQILGYKCIEHFYLSHERELFVWFRTREAYGLKFYNTKINIFFSRLAESGLIFGLYHPNV